MRSLQDHFKSLDPLLQGSGWNACWEEEWTPWDRGGRSWALYDLLEENSALFNSLTERSAGRKTTLVPGCGRGHDVLLLSSFGYDVYGLDYSPKAIEEARRNAKKAIADGVYPARSDDLGLVTWLSGDFFMDNWLREANVGGKFDLIFDYTFLCALHPVQRPRWAERMRNLLAANGRLVCLEFPSRKPTEPGPPWALPPHVYVTYLSQPGAYVETDEFGGVSSDDTAQHTNSLMRVAHFKPRRTFAAGMKDGIVEDWISVWKHKD